MANAWASYVTNIKERAPGDFGNGAIIGKDGSKWVDQVTLLHRFIGSRQVATLLMKCVI